MMNPRVRWSAVALLCFSGLAFTPAIACSSKDGGSSEKAPVASSAPVSGSPAWVEYRLGKLREEYFNANQERDHEKRANLIEDCERGMRSVVTTAKKNVIGPLAKKYADGPLQGDRDFCLYFVWYSGLLKEVGPDPGLAPMALDHLKRSQDDTVEYTFACEILNALAATPEGKPIIDNAKTELVAQLDAQKKRGLYREACAQLRKKLGE